jgi:GST-like protein
MGIEGLPPVWQWTSGNGGKFAGINRPTAGARFDRELPQGEHPLQLHSLATPNGQKVTILLEELLAAGYPAEYDAWFIDIMEGDQFSSGFVAVNPNSKIPALVDFSDPAQPIRVFESGAILLYLADKYRAFVPDHLRGRTETLNWLFWQMGAGPLLGGGFGHFFAYAPEPIPYAIDRFAMEAKRQLDLLDKQLSDRCFIAGDDYSIADIAIWPWYGRLAMGEAYEGADRFLATRDYSHLMRWAEQIAERPAVQRGIVVNRGEGEPAVRERHSARDIDEALNREPAAAK